MAECLSARGFLPVSFSNVNIWDVKKVLIDRRTFCDVRSRPKRINLEFSNLETYLTTLSVPFIHSRLKQSIVTNVTAWIMQKVSRDESFQLVYAVDCYSRGTEKVPRNVERSKWILTMRCRDGLRVKTVFVIQAFFKNNKPLKNSFHRNATEFLWKQRVDGV